MTELCQEMVLRAIDLEREKANEQFCTAVVSTMYKMTNKSLQTAQQDLVKHIERYKPTRERVGEGKKDAVAFALSRDGD